MIDSLVFQPYNVHDYVKLTIPAPLRGGDASDVPLSAILITLVDSGQPNP